jgi:hypothetical protein
MNAPTYHYDATGERIEDVDPEPSVANTPVARREPYRMPLDSQVVAHCNELRRILAESRARREAQQ